MTTAKPRNFSVLTKDLERNPDILRPLMERLQRETNIYGPNVTVTTHGDVTTITAA
jgi:hypothetical protein